MCASKLMTHTNNNYYYYLLVIYPTGQIEFK